MNQPKAEDGNEKWADALEVEISIQQILEYQCNLDSPNFAIMGHRWPKHHPEKSCLTAIFQAKAPSIPDRMLTNFW